MIDKKIEKKIAIYTIVSNNYLHFAKTLLTSVKQHHPEADLFCIIVDKDLKVAEKYINEFKLINSKDLNIENFAAFSFQYNVLELNTAVKPWAMETLLDQGYENVVYIDPDIYIYKRMNEVLDALNSHADIVITPHLLDKIDDNKRPTELDIRRAGTYNFGFCAVKKTSNTYNFLKWWQTKLYRECVVDLDRGIFVDQSWIDLVPGLFEKVYILRHQGYNVAYWNIAQRSITCSAEDNWKSNGEDLIFFHFSGFNPLKPENFSKHQNRYTLNTLGLASKLVNEYAKKLILNGANEISKFAYSYGHFNDGSKVPDLLRRIYLKNGILQKKMGPSPYDASDVLCSLAELPDLNPEFKITWAMYTVWSSREDLKKEFSIITKEGAVNYWLWFLAEGSNYFCSKTINKHNDDWSTYNDSNLTWVQKSNSIILEKNALSDKIFEILFNRNPGGRSQRYLNILSKYRFTATIGTLILALMPESRQRKNLSSRFLKAAKLIWSKNKEKKNYIDHTENFNKIVKQDDINYLERFYFGIFSNDSQSKENGIWCGEIVYVPLPLSTIKKITITGSCPISLHERCTSVKKVIMDLVVNEKHIYRKIHTSDDKFTIEFELLDIEDQPKFLQIHTKSSFIPQKINLNNDQRSLSWRVNKISIDYLDVLDSSKNIPFLTVEKFLPPNGINLVGYLSAESGVGEASRTMASAAQTAGIPYSIIDAGYQTTNRKNDRRAWASAVDAVFDVDMLYVNADQAQSTLNYLSSLNRINNTYKIGFWHWEQQRLPHSLINAFKGLNEIWVPSSFVQESVAFSSPIPVFKVPHAVEFSLNPNYTKAIFGIPEGKFTVLVMYDFDSYAYRKNPEAAISVYKLATKGRDDASLVIKTINAEFHPEQYAALKSELEGINNVIFIDGYFTREQIYGLEASCDCMLSLHRAEGFGFGPAEMMYLGKPVIATGWSGNMEFMTPMNSFPVNYELKPLTNNVGVYIAGLDWAEPDVEHAASCLRSLLDNPSLGKIIGLKAKHTMIERFNSHAVGRHYIQRLSHIRAMYS